MKTSTIIWIAGGALAAYAAYSWLTAGASATTTQNTPATGPTQDPASLPGSGSPGASNGLVPDQGVPGAWPGGNMYGGPYPPNNIMFMPPPVPIGHPGHALAFGAWFAQLPPWRRAELAKLPYARRLQAYRSYTASWAA